MTHTHGHGLSEDLQHMLALAERRRFMRTLLGASLIPLVGCGTQGTANSAQNANSTAGNGNSTVGNSNSNSTAGGSAECAVIPEETGGPYPGDGSNGPNILTSSGIVRSDIRSSFGSLTGTAAGVPLTLELTLVSQASGCAAPVSGAVYVWHCDRDGHYSLYTAADQNYLRGVQETDASGSVTFTTIFPACYSGRWPHIHFEIFPSLASATAQGNTRNTSQLALPADACNAVFATPGYSASVQNFANISLATDMVFSDGATLETPTLRGDVTSGFTAAIQVAV